MIPPPKRCVLVTQLCPTLCDCMDYRDFPGKNTGVGCHFLLQGIFPNQGLNLALLHCRWTLYDLSHLGYCPHLFLFFITIILVALSFPDGSAGKESACIAGDLGLIPGWGRSPGEGNGYPLQYSGLENSMDSPWMETQRVGHD